jgi:hypothetical protein
MAFLFCEFQQPVDTSFRRSKHGCGGLCVHSVIAVDVMCYLLTSQLLSTHTELIQVERIAGYARQ